MLADLLRGHRSASVSGNDGPAVTDHPSAEPTRLDVAAPRNRCRTTPPLPATEGTCRANPRRTRVASRIPLRARPTRETSSSRRRAANRDRNLADEASEVTGLALEQSQPVQTEDTEPELSPPEDASHVQADVPGGSDAESSESDGPAEEPDEDDRA